MGHARDSRTLERYYNQPRSKDEHAENPLEQASIDFYTLRMESQVISKAIDTLYIVTSSPAHSWGIILPWVGLGLTILGWFANSSFSRRNQLKSFEEGVLDKIRLEINKELSIYREWVLKWNFLVMDAFPFNPATSKKYAIEITNHIEKELITPLSFLVHQYSPIFKNITPIFEALHNHYSKTLAEFTKFVQKDITTTPIAENEIEEMRSKISYQLVLIDQYFNALQYDCLRSLNRIKDYKNRQKDGSLYYRDENGTVHIYELPKIGRIKKIILDFI